MKHFLSFLLVLVLATQCGMVYLSAAAEETMQTDAKVNSDGSIKNPDVVIERPDITFNTQDLDGNIYTDEIFAQNTLTILNFWEPWCGPCVSEMPDLQQISQDYADKGVMILGIYSTPSPREEIDDVLLSTGVTYPILHYTSAFDSLQTGYVPTTVIVDGSGKIVKPPFSGSLRYEQWAALIEGLL